MPVVARQIQPSEASSRPLPKEVQNALEGTAVFTVGSLIRQMGDLARLSEDLLGDLAEGIGAINERTKALERRLNAVQQQFAGMDVDKELAQIEPGEVRLEKRPFSSNNRTAQQVLSSQPVPAPLREVYEGVAEPIPALGQFAGMREDGVFPVKFVSDPSFFFEHWRYTMQMQTTRKRTSAIVTGMERDPSVQPDLVLAGGTSTPSPRAQRSHDLLLEVQDHSAQIHRRHKTGNLGVPQASCVGSTQPVSIKKQEDDRMVFELCNVDVPSRCGSALENGRNHPFPEDAGDSLCKDEVSVHSGSEGGAGVGALIYEDEHVVVVGAARPANKPKRRFSFSGFRRSFRRTSSKEKHTTVEEQPEKTEGEIAPRGSFRRGSFKRKSSEKNINKEDRKVKTLSLRREAGGTREVHITADIQKCEGDAQTASNPAPFATMLTFNGEQRSPIELKETAYDSGLESASSSLDPSSRTTSVSSSGTLNCGAKPSLHELSMPSIKSGTPALSATIPVPPPPPPLPGMGKGYKPDASSKRVSVPALSVGDMVKKDILRRNRSADVRPTSSALLNATKPTLLPSQFRPPTQSKPFKAPVPIPINGKNGVKVPPPVFAETTSHDSSPINATKASDTPTEAMQDLNQATTLVVPTVAQAPPDSNELLLAIKRALHQRRSLLQEGSTHNQPLDVAAILERRNVLSLSDDETDGSNDEWD